MVYYRDIFSVICMI